MNLLLFVLSRFLLFLKKGSGESRSPEVLIKMIFNSINLIFTKLRRGDDMTLHQHQKFYRRLQSGTQDK